ncbi:DUF1127 domain-containing protein [Rhizobium mongolense]|uniref:DUF1127 domain-containing protein n=1 Tax=Rhizobium mongolense TaxID=57676 RepID=UPI0034A215A6
MATIETTYTLPGGRDSDISQFSGANISIMSMLTRLEQHLEKRRTRKALLEMSDAQLKDIALSRADAYREANRRFWD